MGTKTLAALLGIGLAALSGTVAAADGLAYCKADVARLCPGMEPGGGRIIGCLKAHKMEVSVGCAKALKAMKAKMGT
jgi:Cysteine rich repeat